MNVNEVWIPSGNYCSKQIITNCYIELHNCAPFLLFSVVVGKEVEGFLFSNTSMVYTKQNKNHDDRRRDIQLDWESDFFVEDEDENDDNNQRW